MKSKLEIYALSVCFASVVCLVISSGIGGYSILKVTNPDLTMHSYKYEQYQSNDSYWHRKSFCPQNVECPERPNEELLTKQREEGFSQARVIEKREGIQTLIQCLIFVLFGGISLFVHWRIAKSARQNA